MRGIVLTLAVAGCLVLGSPIAAGGINKNITVTSSSDPSDDYESVNGNVTIEEGVQLDASSEVSTVNGSIRVGANAVVGEVETVNGSVKFGDYARADAVSTVNGSIRMPEGVDVAGNVETVNGSLKLGSSGRVGGSLENVNGSIELTAATVEGSVITYSGDVVITDGSTVGGDLMVKKSKSNGWKWGKRKTPEVVIGPNSRVQGDLVFEREVDLYVHTSASVGNITGAQPISFSGDRP